MKKLLTTFFLLSCIVISVKAQDASGSDDQKFHFGLKATPTLCWLRVDAEGVKNDGIRIGFTYGLTTEFRIAKNYAFATGVDVSYRGGKYRVDLGSLGELKVTQRLQYLDVPIALKLKTNEIGYIKYYGSFGFLPGVLIKANQDVDSPNTSLIPNSSKRSNQSDFSAFNMGLVVGGGLEYNVGGSTSFTAGLVYNNGFIDIWDMKDAQMNTDYITLNLGILF